MKADKCENCAIGAYFNEHTAFEWACDYMFEDEKHEIAFADLAFKYCPICGHKNEEIEDDNQ